MDSILRDFILFISVEKGLSKNSIEAYTRDLKNFLYFLKNNNLDIKNLNIDYISSYIAELNRRLAVSSVVRNIMSIKVFCKFLFREAIILTDVNFLIESPKMWNKIPGVLSIEEAERLMKVPYEGFYGSRDKAILELLYSSGLRVSELCNLSIYDVGEDFINVLGKGSKERIVPIGKLALFYIDKYLNSFRSAFDSSTNKWLFINSKGRQINRNAVWKVVKKNAELSKIEKNIYPHTLRHSFATHLLNNGADIRIIQEMMGHSSIQTTDKYMHLKNKQMFDAFNINHPRP